MNKVLIKRLGKDKKSTFKLNKLQIEQRTIFLNKLFKNMYKEIPNSCVCGSKVGIVVALIDRYELPVRTVLCNYCGIIRTDPYLDQESILKFYNNEYRPLYVGKSICTEDFFFEQKDVIGKPIYDYLKARGLLENRRTIVEIGCGAGGILEVFREKGFEVFGCDLGNEYLEYGRKKGLSLFNGDSSVLYNICKADVIILNHVLEHCRNPVETIIGLKSLLKEYGIIYIALPGILSIRETYGDLLMYLQNAHIFHYTLGTLDFVLELAGFKRIFGDEQIQAVYTKAERIFIDIPQKEFYKIKKYLLKLEKERIKIKIKHFLKERIKKIIRWSGLSWEKRK